MGKPTGFMEYARELPLAREPLVRLRDWQEFHEPFSEIKLKEQGARINVWGVGTKLVTGYDQPAMGGVYKLSAIRTPGAPWQYKIKLSEETEKMSDPGILQVRRYYSESKFLGDMIYDEESAPAHASTMVDLSDPAKLTTLPTGTPFTNLLVPVLRSGKAVYETPPLAQIQQYTQEQLTRFHAAVKRFDNPQLYPVGLEQHLHEQKNHLISQAREATAERKTHGTERSSL